MDIVGDLLQRLEVGDVGQLITSLLQQRLVDDDAIGLIAVADRHGLAGSVLQVEVLRGHFLHDVSVIQRIAEVAIGVDGALIAHLEHGGGGLLVQLGGQHGVILAGGGGDHFDLHAGLLGIGLGQILPGLVGFGLEVQIINRALCLVLAGAAGDEGKRHDQSKEGCKKLFHHSFLLLKFIFAPGPGGKNNENQSLRMDAPSRSAVGSVS